jgi:hypothetical protein
VKLAVEGEEKGAHLAWVKCEANEERLKSGYRGERKGKERRSRSAKGLLMDEGEEGDSRLRYPPI